MVQVRKEWAVQKTSVLQVVAIVLTGVSLWLLYAVSQIWGPPEAVATFVVDTQSVSACGSFSQPDPRPHYEYFVKYESGLMVPDEILRKAIESPRIQDTAWYRGQPSSEAALKHLQDSFEARVVENTILFELCLRLDPIDDSLVVLREVVDTHLAQEKAAVDAYNALTESYFRRLFISDRSSVGDLIRVLKEKTEWLVQGREYVPMMIESEEIKSAYRLSFEKTFAELQQEIKTERAKVDRIDIALAIMAYADPKNGYVRVRQHTEPAWR